MHQPPPHQPADTAPAPQPDAAAPPDAEPITLHPPRFVPLDPKHERDAVAMLVELLARYADRTANDREHGKGRRVTCRPCADDDHFYCDQTDDAECCCGITVADENGTPVDHERPPATTPVILTSRTPRVK